MLRFPGSRFNAEQNTSLPKQEKAILSMACASGSREAMSGIVVPRPFAYCVLTMAGIFSMPATGVSAISAYPGQYAVSGTAFRACREQIPMIKGCFLIFLRLCREHDRTEEQYQGYGTHHFSP